MADRAPTSPATIDIRLTQPQQLFNSLDPSPFHEHDLDEDAELYIVDSADEYPLDQPLTLVVYLPASPRAEGRTWPPAFTTTSPTAPTRPDAGCASSSARAASRSSSA